MAISMDEILMGRAKLSELPADIQANLLELCDKMNKVRSAYGKPMKVSSGIRTMADHLRIYAEKGITDQSKIPMKSKHLLGQACDIYDPKKELKAWCIANVKLLESIGVWLEAFEDTPNWVHFQSKPYGSWVPGKSIWFKP